MATHSSTLAWKIPWEEPGRLQSMESQRVRHDWTTSLHFTPWKKSYDQPRQHMKKQRHYFVNKGPSSQGYGFSSSHVWMGQTVKKAECQRTDAFELWCWRRLLRVPWTARRSNQSILKEISPEYSLEGLMLKLKLQYFGHLMRRFDFIWKDPDARKDWRREEKGMTENEMVGWHHRLNGYEFEKTLGVGDGHGGLACYSPWGCKELHTTERLNWTEQDHIQLGPDRFL